MSDGDNMAKGDQPVDPRPPRWVCPNCGQAYDMDRVDDALPIVWPVLPVAGCMTVRWVG